ncbi:MAG: RNA methyltransferase [Propionibacteriaceae bacterium]|nr:RNA methyltransferase [Propionibacteriaceae bacterium]
MATFVDVDDVADSRLQDYVGLREASLRRTVEIEQGLFIAEGDKVILRAAEAGFQARSFMITPRWVPGLKGVLDSSDATCYIVSEALAEAVTGFHVHRGALACFHRKTTWTCEQVIDGAQRLVVAEDIVDHTNVGAIIRSTAGLGWDGMLLAPRAADPLYRRSIKTSMGAVFSLPWARLDSWADGLDDLHRRGFTVIALSPREDALPLADLAQSLKREPRPIALLAGTEGAGLSEHWLGQADIVTRIPMSADVDSLNVAAATAIACYALGPAAVTSSLTS